ncbi:unnamed protein product [Penicillium camemberti]|uniref:Str. FM013 n=1 Tax=Penicillium camemberti (strain FM 013) TaxID=1429867 RepID=A0A0G4NXK1_PENC3|nr:unnamed protein product [Penicillium camemberti]
MRHDQYDRRYGPQRDKLSLGSISFAGKGTGSSEEWPKNRL